VKVLYGLSTHQILILLWPLLESRDQKLDWQKLSPVDITPASSEKSYSDCVLCMLCHKSKRYSLLASMPDPGVDETMGKVGQ